MTNATIRQPDPDTGSPFSFHIFEPACGQDHLNENMPFLSI
jgi:hypothetical protein